MQTSQSISKPAARKSVSALATDGTELLRSAVLASLKQANGNVQEAARLLKAAGDKNITLRDAINQDRYFESCLHHVSLANRAANARRWNVQSIPASISNAQATQPTVVISDRNRKRAEAYADDILMTTIPGFGFLKDAKRSDLLTAADFYEKQGKTMMQKGTWMRLIAKSMNARSKVGSTLSVETLRKLQQEAQNA